MGARNLTGVLLISKGTRIRKVSSSVLLRIAYHGVGVPPGVVMT